MSWSTTAAIASPRFKGGFSSGNAAAYHDEPADLPRLRFLEWRCIAPDRHRSDGAAGVAELAGDERVAVACGAACLLRELHEAIDVVAGLEFRQLRLHRLLGFGHGC